MNIKELQKELVEKISLILVEEDNVTLGEEALKIINKLKKHINDDIIINNTDGQKLTALDCVIIADSRGDNQPLSERPRINNKILKKLENAIRDAGRKTSEELGRTENIFYIHGISSAPVEQTVQTANVRSGCVRNEIVKNVTYGLCILALFASSCYLIQESQNGDKASTSVVAGVVGVVGLAASVILGISNSIGRICKERRVHANVENVTVESVGEERQPTVNTTIS